MYPNSQAARLPAQTLALGGQYIPPPYDFGYQVPGVAEASAGGWNSVYAPREEFPYYGLPGSSPGPGAGQVSYASAEFGGTPTGGAAFPAYNFFSGQEPYCPRRRAQEAPRPPASAGKTRTKDKYRVVYTDHQRLELEREFQLNRYITMRRKSELSMALNLSERQVKIWFQNRRAKERKINRKKLQHSQQASTTTPTPPVLGAAADALTAASPTSNILSGALSDDY